MLASKGLGKSLPCFRAFSKAAFQKSAMTSLSDGQMGITALHWLKHIEQAKLFNTLTNFFTSLSFSTYEQVRQDEVPMGQIIQSSWSVIFFPS